MKTETITVRLPVEQVEALKKMADSRALKVSDVVKEMITAGIEGRQSSADTNAGLVSTLKDLEKNLIGGQDWLSSMVLANLRATAGARYFAQLAMENTDEVISYLANQKPLDSKTKAQWRKSRGAEEDKQADQWIDEARLINEPDQETGG